VVIENSFDAILFDLDGTLVDTAPDMVAVLADMMRHDGREPVVYALGRSHVSNGSAGLIKLGFPDVNDDRHELLRLEYLDRYEQAVCVRSRIFDGLDALLDELDDRRVPWGIVTNKPARTSVSHARLAAIPLPSANRIQHLFCWPVNKQALPRSEPFTLAMRRGTSRPAGLREWRRLRPRTATLRVMTIRCIGGRTTRPPTFRNSPQCC